MENISQLLTNPFPIFIFCHFLYKLIFGKRDFHRLVQWNDFGAEFI